MSDIASTAPSIMPPQNPKDDSENEKPAVESSENPSVTTSDSGSKNNNAVVFPSDTSLSSRKNSRITSVLPDKRSDEAVHGKDLDENRTENTGSLGGKREVILLIRGMVERIVISEDTVFRLGRFEVAKEDHDIDLTPYGAIDRGVSRVHAQFHLKEDRLYVTDLASTNGTFLANRKLPAYQPTVLRKGDELRLGRLSIQVLFR